MPRTISHTLIYNVSLKRLHLLPHQFAAVFGQPFAIRLGRGNVGIGVVITRTDCDGAQGAERDKRAPAAAMADAVSAAPGRVILAANDSAAGAARRHSAQACRGDGSRALWRDNPRSRTGRYHLATCGSRGDRFRSGLRLPDYARSGFRLSDRARCRQNRAQREDALLVGLDEVDRTMTDENRSSPAGHRTERRRLLV